MGLLAVIFAGGDPPVAADVVGLSDVGLTIAADSGYDHAAALGFTCDLLVGDLDSVSREGLESAQSAGTEIIAHPRDKSQTDLELAMSEAMGRGAARIVVVGGHGGRLDHLLANLAVLACAVHAGVQVEAHMGGTTVWFVRDGLEIAAPVGTLVSILPVGGSAEDVSSHGLRWELDRESLLWGSARGISNEVIASPAGISVGSGTLIVVQPGPPAAQAAF
jgi:thiamine pyrophosphokinase